ncbi:hypothetical protein SNEBB_002801 [Seison nebaliae]|nr:hypothetical protein SNEBB_002801 [Seison nebaliae]
MPKRPIRPIEINTNNATNDFQAIELRSPYLNIDGDRIRVNVSDIDVKELIGSGNFSSVNRAIYLPKQFKMAVKRTVMADVAEKELRDYKISSDQNLNHPNVIKFYGAFIHEGDCCIFMQLMDTSFERLLSLAVKEEEFRSEAGGLPLFILMEFIYTMLDAMEYLHQHSLMHRDMKPSNVLIDCQGNICLCDFNLAGRLIDSITKSKNVGCRLYMAPERIDPSSSSSTFSIKCDVWSFGITIIELAQGYHPYQKCKSYFEHLLAVVEEQPPKLSSPFFSCNFKDFVNSCITKEYQNRPDVKQLQKHFLISGYKRNGESVERIKNYFLAAINKIDNDSSE